MKLNLNYTLKSQIFAFCILLLDLQKKSELLKSNLNIFQIFRWSSIIKSSHKIGKNHAITIRSNSQSGFVVEIPLEELKYGRLEVISDPADSFEDWMVRRDVSKISQITQSLIAILKIYSQFIQEVTIDEEDPYLDICLSLKLNDRRQVKALKRFSMKNVNSFWGMFPLKKA